MERKVRILTVSTLAMLGVFSISSGRDVHLLWKQNNNKKKS